MIRATDKEAGLVRGCVQGQQIVWSLQQECNTGWKKRGWICLSCPPPSNDRLQLLKLHTVTLLIIQGTQLCIILISTFTLPLTQCLRIQNYMGVSENRQQLEYKYLNTVIQQGTWNHPDSSLVLKNKAFRWHLPHRTYIGFYSPELHTVHESSRPSI